ncbi:uncharacterized protein LOC114557945 isoform X2 [Perca flavescens]|uniref:uncharacterized protein LOC114557945 isoform X2 n=1 Tax=Perca flavescens TaxID=8167 RepID=UPI00106E8449|nr:uncharacterized protein LOC114557945 isoform X2 [Perca flavescens]
MKVSRNGSLVIDHFTEDDQGLYSCEKPYSDTVITVKKEILKETDAGKYTCWKSGCNGHRQKLLTINLCVITVHHGDDSFVSCTVMCDMEFSNIKPNSTLYLETGTRTMLVDTNGINCSAKQMSDGCSSVNSTHGPSNALNITTDIPTELEYLIPVVYGTSAALTCLILMALLICHLRQRLWAAFPVHPCCWGLNSRVEEETSVVYSSVVIRKPAKTTNNHMSCDSSCVYSEIKVQRTIP